MMSDKCKCGHTKMYHSVMGRCQHRDHGVPACRCIEFTPTDSVHEFPTLTNPLGETEDELERARR